MAARKSRQPMLTFVVATMAAAAAVYGFQDPGGQVFRGSVDVVAVDVQVVNRRGEPVAGLKPESFQVSIDGKPRRVISAQFIGNAADETESTPAFRQAAAAAADRPMGAPRRGRTFILAIDAGSFSPGEAAAAAEGARRFVELLDPEDLLGLYVYPTGPRIPATDERARVLVELRNMIGQRSEPRSQFNMQPSEIVDITAGGAISAVGVVGRGRATLLNEPITPSVNPIIAVQARECPEDPVCASRIFAEASALALHYEGQATISLGHLDNLLQALASSDGRKFVMLISGGLLISDRPGGRPDIGDLARVMGQTAARANAVIYTIHADSTFATQYSAGRRRANVSENQRDRRMIGQWLETFSTASGGTSMYVPVGPGDYAFNRVLRETSSYYLLGVEPSSADRGTSARELKVRVNLPDATIRSRQWVVIK